MKKLYALIILIIILVIVGLVQNYYNNLTLGCYKYSSSSEFYKYECKNGQVYYEPK